MTIFSTLVMQMIKSTAYFINSIIKEISDAYYWSKLPNNEFTKKGFVIIENFLDSDLCDELVQVGIENSKEKSQMIADNVWINVRAEAADGKDSKVKNIFNFNLLNKKLDNLINSNVLTEKLEAQLGDKVILKTCSLQIDEPDTRTKRSWHVDRNPPPTFKAFIYLTDVDSELEGPYCAIPRSHKWRVKRLLNIFTNIVTGAKRSDMHRYIGERDDYFLAKKGTLIFSTQTLFHRGSPKHERKTRYMLINYFKAEKYDDGKEFELGKPEEWMMN